MKSSIAATTAAPKPSAAERLYSSSLAPNFARKRNHKPELLLLHLRRDRIAGVDAGEAALRTDREPVEVDVSRRVLDALFKCILVFQDRCLGRDNAEHDGLVARHQTQRRERAG